MSVIPYTTDRHQMLIAVQEGGIRRVEFGGIDPIWVSPTGDAYRGNDLRTLNYLFEDGVVTYGHGLGTDRSDVVTLGGDGVEILGEWDAEQPATLPAVNGPWTVERGTSRGEEKNADGETCIDAVYLNPQYAITNGTISLLLDVVASQDLRIAQAIAAKLSAPA